MHVHGGYYAYTREEVKECLFIALNSLPAPSLEIIPEDKSVHKNLLEQELYVCII